MVVEKYGALMGYLGFYSCQRDTSISGVSLWFLFDVFKSGWMAKEST
jgi:hypothetical protein